MITGRVVAKTFSILIFLAVKKCTFCSVSHDIRCHVRQPGFSVAHLSVLRRLCVRSSLGMVCQDIALQNK